jgi:hypothetical protein
MKKADTTGAGLFNATQLIRYLRFTLLTLQQALSTALSETALQFPRRAACLLNFCNHPSDAAAGQPDGTGSAL